MLQPCGAGLQQCTFKSWYLLLISAALCRRYAQQSSPRNATGVITARASCYSPKPARACHLAGTLVRNSLRASEQPLSVSPAGRLRC